MRALSLACLLLTLSAPAMAEDRYGPQNPAALAAASAALAPTARLSWHGKVEPAGAVSGGVAEPMRPLADGVLRRTGAYGAAPPAMRAPAPAQMAVAAPPAENAPWKRLLNSPAPAAAPVAMEEAPAQPAPQAPPAEPVAAPAPPAAARPYAAARPAPAAGDQARYYSLHREYGETPDAIPAPQKTQVFLAGGPLNSGVGDGDAAETDSTGKTAALNKARIAADWRASADQ